ncbi:MAG: response regulator receiver protein [Methylobacteriaceae bacterium]
MTNPNAHHIGQSFDHGLTRMSSVLAGMSQDRRILQAEAAQEARARTAVAGRRARHAVERQRLELVETLRENARLRAEATALRTENAILRAELARMRSRALEAEGCPVRLAKEARSRTALRRAQRC